MTVETTTLIYVVLDFIIFTFRLNSYNNCYPQRASGQAVVTYVLSLH